MSGADCNLRDFERAGVRSGSGGRAAQMANFANTRADNIGEARQMLSAALGSCEILCRCPDSDFSLELRHMEFERSGLFRLHSDCDIEIGVDCNRHLVCVCPEGHAAFQQDGDTLLAEGPSAVILAPGRGRVRCAAGSTLVGLIIPEAGFRQEAVAVLQGALSVRLGATRSFDVSINPGRIFLDVLQMLQADLDNAQVSRDNKSIRLMFDRLIVYGLLRIVGGDALNPAGGSKHSLAPRHIKRAEEYIKAHLAEHLDNVLLAHVAQVSPRSLHRGFVHFRGMTPARYVQELRLNEAHKMLTAGDRIGDIHTIAALSGFRSYASFWRSYVRKYGAPPSKSRPPRGFSSQDSSKS